MRFASLGMALLVTASLAAACGSGSSKPETSSAPASDGTSAAQAQTPTISTSQPALATPATNPFSRVDGTVQSVDGNTVTLKEGGSFTLAPKTTFIRNVPASVNDLVPGKIVHVTAKQQPDNSLLASAIGVDASTSNGTRLGQNPMDGGNLMTNATIASGSGNSFMVTFPGGAAKVKVAPDAKVTTLTPAAASDLAAGESVSAAVSNGAAQFVLILSA